MEGTIKRLIKDRGFGFITVEGEAKDLYFSSSEVKNVKFEELNEGDKVSFDKADSPKGPKATNVNKI
jgi:CspA family cold shock protein